MIYYVYVLKSLNDKNIYIGWTNNLERRMHRHSQGFVASTKNRRPLELIYFEGCIAKKDAIAREKSLKTGFGRSYLKRRLKYYYDNARVAQLVRASQ